MFSQPDELVYDLDGSDANDHGYGNGYAYRSHCRSEQSPFPEKVSDRQTDICKDHTEDHAIQQWEHQVEYKYEGSYHDQRH